ncbi:1-acyl-sn-glycerol-3-phosphate acyltransferase delta, partial [Asbolus verrucosus]
LLLFPEGTRFTPAKHKTSLEFARQKNLPELKHHLLPRTKGFTASLPPMKGKIPALYDIEICFKEDDPHKPTIRDLLLGNPVVAHMYMRRIPLEDLPQNEHEQEVFLREMFERKDRLRDSFIKTGDYFATSGVPRLEPFELERRINSLINIAVWVVVICCPMVYYLIKLLFSGELLYFSIGASIIGAFYLLLNKTIGMSEIKKGSSYGTNTPKKND